MSHQQGRKAGVVSETVGVRPEDISARPEVEEEEETQEDVATETPVVVVQQTHIHNAAQPQEKVMTTQNQNLPTAAVQLTPEQIQALMMKAQALSPAVQQKLLAMDAKQIAEFSESVEKGTPWYKTTAFMVGLGTLTVAATGVAVKKHIDLKRERLANANLATILSSGTINDEKTSITIGLPVQGLNNLPPANRHVMLNNGAFALSF